MSLKRLDSFGGREAPIFERRERERIWGGCWRRFRAAHDRKGRCVLSATLRSWAGALAVPGLEKKRARNVNKMII